MGAKLKTGVLDWGGGNRLNAVNYTEFQLWPDMFENEANGQTLSSFSGYDVYDEVNCIGRSDSGNLYVKPTCATGNEFSFSLTNGGTSINGFALATLSEENISISLVRTTLNESTSVLSKLCTSPKMNILSPRKPNGNSPYRLGDFRGYCHNASGGLNIYNPNGSDVAYTNTYTLFGSGTENQEGFGSTTLTIYVDNVEVGSVTKNLSSGSGYLEKLLTGFTNNEFWTTTKSIKVEGVYNSNIIGTSTVSKVFRGQPFAGVLNTLFINVNTARLDYNYHLYNQSASNATVYIKITNTTKGQFAQVTHSLNANSDAIFSGTTGSMGIVNETGDEFTIRGSLDNATWYDFSTSSGTLPYGV